MSSARQETVDDVDEEARTDTPDANHRLRQEIGRACGFENQWPNRFSRCERIQIARAVCDLESEWTLLLDSQAELARRLCLAVDVDPAAVIVTGDDYRLPGVALRRLHERLTGVECDD